MANSDKNISIIPNRSLTGQPQIIFTGQGNDPITLKVLDSTIGSLSFEGSAGQLLSITDSLSSGSIFSVNDISGIPSIDVNADGTVALAPFSGNIAIGVTSASFKLHVNGTLYAASAATFNSNVILSNGNLQTTTSTFNLITNTASIINIGTTSGSTISIASTTGTTTVNNSAIITGNLTVNGGTITSTATTFNLLNTTVTNANVLGAADTILIGSAGGSTTIRNAATRVNGTLTVTGATVVQGALSTNGALSVTGTSTFIGDVTAGGDIAVNGGDITSTATTFNLLNATVTGLNVGGAANTVLLGGTGGTTTIRNAGTNINGTLTITGVSVHQGAGAFNSTLTVTGATVVQGALSTNGALSVTGTSTLIGDVTASGDIAVNGGDITSTATTFNLLNATITNANVLGAANTVVIGGTGGTTTIRNAGTNINGTLTVTGVSVHQGAGAFNSTLTVTGVTTLQGASTLQSAVNMNSTLTVTGVSVHQGAGAFNSTLSVTGAATFVDDIAVNGGDITSTATTFNLLNATVTNANILGAANTILIGGTAGSATIRNSATAINGSLTVTGASTFVGVLNATTVTSTDLLLRTQGGDEGGQLELGTAATNSTLTGGAVVIDVYQNKVRFFEKGAATRGYFIDISNGTANAGTQIGGSATAAGSTTQVQYNNGGAFAGSGNFTFDGSGINVNGLISSGLGITTTGTTFNFVTNTASTINIGTTSGSTISIGNAGGTTTIRNAGTNINGTLTVTGVSIHQGAGSFNSTLSVTGTSTLIGDVTASGDIAVNGGDITSTATAFNLLNTTVTNANVLGAANTVLLGGTGGTATIRNAGTNINGTLTVTGVSIHQGAGAFNSTLSVTGVSTFQSAILANGGTITSSSTTFNLLNTTVTNANVFGAADTISIGSSLGSATIRNANTAINGTLSVTGNATFIGDISVNGGDINSTGALTITAGGSNTNINIVPNGSGTVDVASKRITNLFTPSLDTDAATKKYVDDVAQGLHIHSTSAAATTAKLATLAGVAVTYSPGTQAITWTGGTAVTSVFTDGQALTASTTEASASRILVKNEGDSGGLGSAYNGVYYCYGARELRRATDGNVAADWAGGDFAFVLAGTLYNNTGWVQTEKVTTLDTDPILWEQFSGAGVYTADEVTLTRSGTQFSIKNTYAGQTSINTVGTISTGTWSGSAITIGYGGTGLTTYTAGDISYYASGTALSKLPIGSITTILESTGSAPSWVASSGSGGVVRTISATLTGATLVNPIFTTVTATDLTLSGDIAVNGGDITSTATTFNLLNATVTGLNVGGAANTVLLGGTGGTTTIRNAGTNINGTLTVTGVSVHQGAGAFNSTLSVTGASTLIGDVTASGDIAVNGGDITSTATTFNLLNATVTNANVLGAANTVVLGGTGGTTTIRNAGTNINGTLTVTGVSVHQGAGVFNSTLTVTGATVIQGALSTNGALSVTGTSSLIGDVTASGDIAVNGGDITSTATTFNLLNTTVTGLNLGGAANTVVIGGTGGTTTIRNASTNINGTLTVTGATVIQGALSTNSTLSVTSNAIFVGSILANGGTITSTATTFNLLNTTVTNANVLGAATIIVIGANSSGTALIRNSNILLGGTVTGTTTISTTTGTAAHLTISPQGNLTLSPLGSIGAGGIRPSVTVPNNSAGTGTISISGAYVLIGNRNDGGSDYSGEIRIQEQSGNDYFGLKTADTMAASTTYTLPSAFPASAGYVLQSTTTGLMTWAAPSSSASLGVTATSASENYKLVFTDVNATNTSASLLIDTTSGIVYNPSTDALVVNGALSTNSTLSVTGEATFAGSILANGGTITSSATTFNLLNTTVTNANVLGSANTILIGSISGTTTIRNAGTNINGNLTVSGSSSFGAAVDHVFGLSNRGLKINAGKGTSEILSYGNETLAVSGMGGNGFLELFGGNVTVGDDGNNDGTQIVVNDASGQTITYNASGGHIFSGVGSFDGLLTASAGISVSGATAAIFNGTVSCNSSTIYKPTLQYYNEVLASPTISANVLTLDLSTAQMFTVSLNANITTFTITNTPATANRSIGFTLIFTADGTARTVTWGSAVKWANNDPPALTSTNGKKDILSFVSPDGGTNWYGFIGGLNF